MANYHSRLVATFCDEIKLNDIVKRIIASFTIERNKLYVYKNMSEDAKMILTYNVLLPSEADKNITQISKKIYNTIFLHRKKLYNTLYSIDSLNRVIMNENNGVLDKSFQINWKNYENKLLLEKDNELVQIPIEFIKSINVGEFLNKVNNPSNNRYNY